MTPAGMRPAVSEWRNWPVLVPSLAGITLVAVHGYSLGVVMHPLEQEFGWSRAAISAGPLLISSIGLVTSPFIGGAIDRYGPRPIAILGVIVYCLGLAFMATTGPDIGSWWLRWAIMSVGSVMILPTVWTTAINSLFSVNRGKALAFALCGTGLSAALVPLLTNALIERFGWRGAYLGLALLALLIVLPLVMLFFRGATDVRAGTTGRPRQASALLPGLSPREGFRSPAFFKLAVAVLLFGVTSLSLTVNAVPVLLAQGFTLSTAAGMASLIGVGSICGRLFGGFLLDQIDARKVAALASVLPVFTVVLFTMFPGAVMPVAIGAFLLGLSLGTEVDACSYLAARHFGMRSFGTLFGTINGLVAFGAGLAPIIANRVYDITGTYHSILIGAMPISVVAMLIFLRLGRYPTFAQVEAPIPAVGPIIAAAPVVS